MDNGPRFSIAEREGWNKTAAKSGAKRSLYGTVN
jgi:hypothetical protein